MGDQKFTISSSSVHKEDLCLISGDRDDDDFAIINTAEVTAKPFAV
jgi:hypothetical protein